MHLLGPPRKLFFALVFFVSGGLPGQSVRTHNKNVSQHIRVHESNPKVAHGRAGDAHSILWLSNVSQSLMTAFYLKRRPTLVFTDFGLGGLSILSSFVSQYMDQPLFPAVNLIYHNAAGYGDLGSTQFAQLLLATLAEDGADLVFIACGSLSSVIGDMHTPLQETRPVLSTIPFGVELFARRMDSDSQFPLLIIFATNITVASGAHRRLLTQMHGIPADRIVSQECTSHGVATGIEETGATSVKTVSNIDHCVAAAWQQVVANGLHKMATTVFAGMACTHYGWAKPAWYTALQRVVGAKAKIEVVDPNLEMARFIFETHDVMPRSASEVRIEIKSPQQSLSQVHFSHVAPLVAKPVRAALLSYPKPFSATIHASSNDSRAASEQRA